MPTNTLYSHSRAGEAKSWLRRSETEVTRWSESWLGYTRFDGVWLTGDDWRAAPEAVRDALWRYVEAGGALLVAGAARLPSEGLPNVAAGDRLRVFYAGFGRAILAESNARNGLRLTISRP